jgi:hypothetical protein
MDPTMMSSRTITLFSERPLQNAPPATFLYSLLAHIAAVVLLTFGIIYTPEIKDQLEPRRYTIRHVDLHTPEEKPKQSASRGVRYPGPHADVHKPAPGKQPAAQLPARQQIANADKGKQTLIQPDIIEPAKISEFTPVPTVVIWTPKKEEVKNLVAPLPEQATAADVKPDIKMPNQEINLGDTAISSTENPTESMAVAPTTTSPLEVHRPDLVQLAPVTASQQAAQPTPTAVMAISDLRMPDGTATLPPVNQTVEQDQPGTLAAGHASTQPSPNSQGGAGVDPAAGDGGETAGVEGPHSGTAPGSGAGSGADQALTTDRFSLPKNGEFGAVIVGANLEEKFPEMSGIWNDRVAYTVYLHVGLEKSWILQYSLPRAAEAARAGDVARLDAPWPYNLVRPNIPSRIFNTDAILVHGYVNQQGRFESLALAFPPEFQQAQFILDALNQWQFRAAAQNGQPEKVEVLLIIPEELD